MWIDSAFFPSRYFFSISRQVLGNDEGGRGWLLISFLLGDKKVRGGRGPNMQRRVDMRRLPPVCGEYDGKYMLRARIGVVGGVLVCVSQ